MWTCICSIVCNCNRRQLNLPNCCCVYTLHVCQQGLYILPSCCCCCLGSAVSLPVKYVIFLLNSNVPTLRRDKYNVSINESRARVDLLSPRRLSGAGQGMKHRGQTLVFLHFCLESAPTGIQKTRLVLPVQESRILRGPGGGRCLGGQGGWVAWCSTPPPRRGLAATAARGGRARG